MGDFHLCGFSVVPVERGEENAAGNRMDVLFNEHIGFSRDAGPGKPAGVREIRMRDLDADLIFRARAIGVFEAGDAADVIGYRNIAVGPFSQIVAVAPDLAVFINSVEADGNFLSPVFFRKR